LRLKKKCSVSNTNKSETRPKSQSKRNHEEKKATTTKTSLDSSEEGKKKEKDFVAAGKVESP
jgi:hypothetical protein